MGKVLGTAVLASTLACGGGQSNAVETHRLAIAVSGQGLVKASAPAADCAAACSQAIAAGAAVHLEAVAGSGMQFAGWTGACSGSGACDVMLSADRQVGAAFEAISNVAADPCAGLVPSLPSPQSVSVAAWDNDPKYCGFPYVDGSGEVYLETGDAVSGPHGMKVARQSILAPLHHGFAAFSRQSAPSGSLSAFSPDGSARWSSPVRGNLSGGGMQAGGGVIAVSADCNVSKKVTVSLVDFDGNEGAPIDLQDQGCLSYVDSSYLDVAVDARGNILLATDSDSISGQISASSSPMARWFDSSGQPITDWFETVGGHPVPLIGGGVAMHSSYDGGWLGSIRSGVADLDASPAGFHATASAQVVLGGRAYAMLDQTSIEIVEPGGKSCGKVATAPENAFIDLGADGSIATVPSAGRDHKTGLCDVTLYSAVLR
jgi:hypothetical protein